MNENIMKYKGYSAAIQYSGEDEALVGRVLWINDVIDFHGDSVARIRDEFHVAIDEYLKACEKLGKKPDKPNSGKLVLRLPPEVHAGLALISETTGQSPSQLIVNAVRATYMNEAPSSSLPKRHGGRRRREIAGAK